MAVDVTTEHDPAGWSCRACIDKPRCSDISESYAAGSAVETQPRRDYAPYRSSRLRHPTKDLQQADPEGDRAVGAGVRSTRRRRARVGPDDPEGR